MDTKHNRSIPVQMKSVDEAKRIEQDQFYLLFCLFLVALIAINQLRLIPIPQFFFLAMTVIFFCICDRKYYTPMLCFLIPLSVWVSLYFIFGFALIIYLIRFHEQIKIHPGVLLVLLAMIIDLSSFFYGEFSLYLWVRASIYYLAIAFFLFSNFETGNAKRVLFSFIGGYMTLCILSLIIIIPLVGFGELISLRFGANGLRDFIDPLGIELQGENRLALNSALVFSLILALLQHCQGKKLVFIVMAIFSVLVELLTKSNTGLFLLVLAIVLLFWSKRKGVKQFLIGISSVGGIAVIFYWTINKYFPLLFESILKRIFVSDISNGRFEILFMYFQRMFEHPEALLFGLGSQNYISFLNMDFDCHNAFQQIFVMWGTIGLILILIFFVCCLIFMRQGIEKKLYSILYYAPVIRLFVGSQAGQFDGLYPFLLPAIYSIRLAELNQREA